jgi:serine protease
MTYRAINVALAALACACASLLAALPVGAESGADRPGVENSLRARFVPSEVVVRFEGKGAGAAVKLPKGVGVGDATAALRRNPRVAYAVPNYIATASDFIPYDPGSVPPAPGSPRGWTQKQWSFLCGAHCGRLAPFLRARGGIDAIRAWRRLIDVDREGANGIRVAVLDTGIAYRNSPGFRRSPDLDSERFVRGHDFVANDALPLDENGHGTHIAGTIGANTDNRIALTGLAYRTKLMPVRVLNSIGNGRSDQIASGIRFAARHGADVINMSFNFDCGAEVPPVAEAIAAAHRRGVVVVASVGNGPPRDCITMPASARHAIAVGGTTAEACAGSYTRTGARLDLVAPGGGGGAVGLGCRSKGSSLPIFQLTYLPGSHKRFGYPAGYVGTSMAAAHVSGVAALILGSGVLPNPSPASVLQRLRGTARDIGAPGWDPIYGCGLIDAGSAVDPAVPAPC